MLHLTCPDRTWFSKDFSRGLTSEQFSFHTADLTLPAREVREGSGFLLPDGFGISGEMVKCMVNEHPVWKNQNGGWEVWCWVWYSWIYTWGIRTWYVIQTEAWDGVGLGWPCGWILMESTHDGLKSASAGLIFRTNSFFKTCSAVKYGFYAYRYVYI